MFSLTRSLLTPSRGSKLAMPLASRISSSLSGVSFVRVAAVRSHHSETFEYLQIEQKGAAKWIILNRPDLHNAFNEDVIGRSPYVVYFMSLSLSLSLSL